jgi:YidC/Oxa1 family membrane protein insertase
MLIKENGSSFSFNFFTTQQLSTSNFGFKIHSSNDTSLVYRLYVDSVSFIEYTYTLPADSYMMDYNVRMVGMNRHIPRKEKFLDLEWEMDVPRQEKGYDNEKNYSTIVYKFPNSKSVEDLGLRKAEANEDIRTKINWFAFQQQFFSAILVAKENFNSGILSYSFYPAEDPDRNLMHCKANVQIPYNVGEEVNIKIVRCRF